MKKFSRRSFIRDSFGGLSLGHAFLSSGVSSLLFQAATALEVEEEPTNFVLLRVLGAMDNTLGLHPWMQKNTLESRDLFLTDSNTPYAPMAIKDTDITLGPSAFAIAPFAKEMAIVRGIMMGPTDLGHPFAIQYMNSGRTQESAPYWTAYIAAQRNAQRKFVVTNSVIPYGSLQNPSLLLVPVLRQLAKSSWLDGSAALGLIQDKSDFIKNFESLAGNRNRIEKFRKIITDFGGKNDEDYVLASIYSGLSSVAQIDIDCGNLDTHAAHAEEHGPHQKLCWERIGNFLQGLKKLDLFKNTMVAVITEFNRTPGLNESGGKDHNYSDNAIALFGKGIRGGRVVGDRRLYTRADGFSEAYFSGKFIDFGSLDHPGSGNIIEVEKSKISAIPNGAALIRPGDVWATIIHGLDPSLKDRLPKDAKVIPRITDAV